jgi:phosphoribosylanthranilate isomerase
MIWPDPACLKGALLETKSLEIILQIGSNALEATSNDPASVVQRFTSYADIVDRVLLDKSMGKGVPMDAETLLPFMRALNEMFPGLGIGVAGGLGPDTIHLVEPIVKEFPSVSIDAQSRLRPSGSALDPINWTMAAGYLAGASLVFR